MRLHFGAGPIAAGVVLIALVAFGGRAFTPAAAGAAPAFPSAALDDELAQTAGRETIVLAGGCFWGVQAVFQHTRGVLRATSGYAGGSLKNPSYEQVSSGATGHAEAVEVVFDPAQISLGQLLQLFFSVAHDPTEVNRQGPDEGPQYRSMILVGRERQAAIARAYIEQLDAARVYRRRIVTEVVALSAFYPAEGYHQDYVYRHPFEPYIMINDRPKVEALKKRYPDRYAEQRAPTS
jgi:peptide-methionine (S)-S-oxide reductase